MTQEQAGERLRCIQLHASILRKRAQELDEAGDRVARTRGLGSSEGHRTAAKELRVMADLFEDPTGLLLPDGRVVEAWKEVEDGVWHRGPYTEQCCLAYADYRDGFYTRGLAPGSGVHQVGKLHAPFLHTANKTLVDAALFKTLAAAVAL